MPSMRSATFPSGRVRAFGRIALAASVALAASAPRPTRADPADLERQGDALYASRDVPGNVEAAIGAYQKALAIDPGRSSAYWKMARTYFWQGMNRTGDASEDAFKEAIEYAKLCVEASDSDAGCHFWLGASYGKYGEVRGVFQSLYLVPFVVREMERVLALDRTFENAGADVALGRMYYLIPEGMPGEVKGDKRKAVKHLRRAVEIAPGNSLARLWLGEALAGQGEKVEARRQLQAVLDGPDPRIPVPEEARAKASARALLGRL